jgi:tetratricopeptide (TPR) repeat protein
MRHHEELGDRAAAIALLEEAVALDAGFASAHRMLGALHRANADHARAAVAYERAFQHRNRLTVRERHLTAGSHHLNVTRDFDAAIAAYRAQLAREPDDRAALNNLSLVYRERRDYRNQEILLRQVLAIDSTIPSVFLALAEAVAHQSRFAEADEVLSEAERRFPAHPITPMTRAYVAAARQDWPAAESHIRRRLELGLARGRRDEVMDARQTLGQILLANGRVDDAEHELRAALELARAEGAHRRVLFTAVQLGWLEHRHRGRTRRALEVVDSVLDLHPLDALHPRDRPYAELAAFFAGAGSTHRLRALVRLAERDSTGAPGRAPAPDDAVHGYMALLDGRPRDAVAAFRRWEANDRCPVCPLPGLAEAYDHLRDSLRAAEVRERYLQTPWIWRFETDAPHLAFTLQRLGRGPKHASETGS